jgi:hypothetical protein
MTTCVGLVITPVTVKGAEAVIAGRGPPSQYWQAQTVWAPPLALLGMLIIATKDPLAFGWKGPRRVPLGTLSHRISPGTLDQPLPVTLTLVPGGPEVGLSEIVGAACSRPSPEAANPVRRSRTESGMRARRAGLGRQYTVCIAYDLLIVRLSTQGQEEGSREEVSRESQLLDGLKGERHRGRRSAIVLVSRRTRSISSAFPARRLRGSNQLAFILWVPWS